MSIWTHVCGCIRFDAFRSLGDNNHPKDFMGNMAHFHDNEKVWDKCDIPCGSEGSLTYSIWESPDESSMAAYTVSIFGDLRSYENTEEIIEYLNRITEDRMVRQGVVTIETEGKKPTTLVYDDEKWVNLGV